MDNQRVFNMSVASVYPHYVNKVQKKGFTKEMVDQIIHWLTGYDAISLQNVLDKQNSFKDFFEQAPQFNKNANKITGVICGHRVEDIQDPLMQKIRYLDKLIDEISKGKQMHKIMRN